MEPTIKTLSVLPHVRVRLSDANLGGGSLAADQVRVRLLDAKPGKAKVQTGPPNIFTTHDLLAVQFNSISTTPFSRVRPTDGRT